MNKLMKIRCLITHQRRYSLAAALPYVNFIENGVRKQLQMPHVESVQLGATQLDWNFLLNENNRRLIKDNLKRRKSAGDIHRLQDEYKQFVKLMQELESTQNETTATTGEAAIKEALQKLYNLAIELPNMTHPDVPIGDESKAKCVAKVGQLIEKDRSMCLSVDQIAEKYNWLTEQQISLFSTPRSYILRGDLAHLEDALVKYTLKYLQKQGFILVSVPDVLHRGIIEACGFSTQGDRTQVYKLDYANDHGRYCLSGTSEMALGGFLRNRVIEESDLPLKLCAISRCYRAEVSGSEREGKLYRLHEFTKVEMFVVTKNDVKMSNKMLDEINSHQIDLFSNLGLHFQILDMPTQELGLPAYRKYDIEAWMPFTQRYGEISSASNCIDYQSRRLNIRSKNSDDEQTAFPHTLNGTACAVPRLLTCIVENNWDHVKRLVHIPKVLQPYMNNQETLKADKSHKIEILKKSDLEEV